VGLKGATGSGKTADVSTASRVAAEERNEALDRSQSGLSGYSRSPLKTMLQNHNIAF